MSYPKAVTPPLVACGFLVLSAGAGAQRDSAAGCPNKPVRFIVPFATMWIACGRAMARVV